MKPESGEIRRWHRPLLDHLDCVLGLARIGCKLRVVDRIAAFFNMVLHLPRDGCDGRIRRVLNLVGMTINWRVSAFAHFGSPVTGGFE